MHFRPMRFTALTLLSLGAMACSPRREYTTPVPANSVQPPPWTSQPFVMNKDGSIQVSGRSVAEDLVLGQSQAELDARVRLARVLSSAAEQLGQREGATQGSVGTTSQSETAVERAKASVAGLAPAELWYDKIGKVQYVLMKMDAARWRSLYAKYDPAAAERTVREFGAKLTLP